jgi:hypothetical protein
MKEKPEVCVWCGRTDVVPKGKIMFKGRKVTEVECKRCGITFVSRKDLPLLDNAFRCANAGCPKNAHEWCRKEQPCPSFAEPAAHKFKNKGSRKRLCTIIRFLPMKFSLNSLFAQKYITHDNKQ